MHQLCNARPIVQDFYLFFQRISAPFGKKNGPDVPIQNAEQYTTISLALISR